MVERLRLEQVDTPEFLDTIHALLADSTRRNALRYLTTHSGPVTVYQLTTELAATDYGIPATDVRPDQRREIDLSLRHAHLPALRDAGLLEWDRDRDLVSLTSLLDHLSVTIPNPHNVLDISVSSRPELP